MQLTKLTKSQKRTQRKKAKAMKGRLIERDGRFCQICRNDSDLTIDHIIPLSRGGKSELDNLQLLCSRCNMLKSSRDTEHVKEYFLEEAERFRKKFVPRDERLGVIKRGARR